MRSKWDILWLGFGLAVIGIALAGTLTVPGNKSTTLVIFCEEYDQTSEKWRVTRHETTNTHPLYRGGWDFTNVEGVRVLNSKCSYNSTNK